jgi:hypothetical protein
MDLVRRINVAIISIGIDVASIAVLMLFASVVHFYYNNSQAKPSPMESFKFLCTNPVRNLCYIIFDLSIHTGCRKVISVDSSTRVTGRTYETVKVKCNTLSPKYQIVAVSERKGKGESRTRRQQTQYFSSFFHKVQSRGSPQ